MLNDLIFFPFSTESPKFWGSGPVDQIDPRMQLIFNLPVQKGTKGKIYFGGV